jgi:tRNA uridine 5-carboxymethylaminomethyl modification enzyme
VLGKNIEHEYSLFELLRRPGVGYEALVSMQQSGDDLKGDAVSRETWSALEATVRDAVVEQVEITAKYSGYIDRQKDEVERAAHYENLRLPVGLDYTQVQSLSFEARHKLAKHQPETLGQASRISGITPATISLLMIYLKKSKFKGFGSLSTSANDAQAKAAVGAE